MKRINLYKPQFCEALYVPKRIFIPKGSEYIKRNGRYLRHFSGTEIIGFLI